MVNVRALATLPLRSIKTSISKNIKGHTYVNLLWPKRLVNLSVQMSGET